MDISYLEMRLLMAFNALLEERNVTRAAQRLGLTQQALSGNLSKLRDIFDDPLFVRARYGVTPTPRAEELGDGVRDILARSEQLLIRKEFDPQSAEATLRVSTLANVQRTVIIPFAARLLEKAPSVRIAVVRFEVEELTEKMNQRGIDLALTVPALAPQDLPSRKMFNSTWVCALRRDHPFKGKRMSMKSFLAQRHIVVSPTDLSFQGSADEALAKAGQRRKVVLSVPDFLICCETLLATDLAAIVPKDVAALYGDSLRCFPVPFEIPKTHLIAVWPKHLDSDPLHKWVREELVSVASKMA